MQQCNKPSATDRNRAWLVQRLWTETNYVKNTTSASSCNLEQVTLTKPPNQNTYKTNNTTAQKIKFSIKDFCSKSDQIRRKLRIWSHLRKKSWIENFIFCAVYSALHFSCFMKVDDNKTRMKWQVTQILVSDIIILDKRLKSD